MRKSVIVPASIALVLASTMMPAMLVEAQESSGYVQSVVVDDTVTATTPSVSNNIQYTLSDGKATIVGLANPSISSSINLVIPAQIDGYPVVAIGNNAFNNNLNIKSVTLNEGLLTIGNCAFTKCTNLTGKITIPSTVTKIDGGYSWQENGAFQSTSISEVEIKEGSSAMTLGSNTFSNCKSLNKVTLSSRVEKIDEKCFYGTSALTNVIFSGNRIMTIESSAFQNSAIKTLTLSSGVRSIGNNAFYGCSSLTSVNLNEGLTTIRKSAFRDCKNLVGQLVVPSTVTSIEGEYSWNNEGAFENTSISEIMIKDGNSALNLGAGAFRNCKSLKKVTLSNRIQKIDDCCFSGNSGLATAVFKAGNFDTTIGKEAFYNTGLTTLSLSSNVVSLGENAFGSCKSLTGVTLSSGLKTIGNSAFSECVSLKGITLNQGLTKIGHSAFKNCSSLSGIVTIPSSVTEIDGGYSWNDNGAFQNTSISEVQINDGNESLILGANAFRGCKNLSKVSLSDRIKEIGEQCFYNDANLKTVVFKNGKNNLTIKKSSFAGSGITSLILSSNVNTIESNAFNACKSLKTVTFNEGLTTIGASAFKDCINLTGTLTIPSTVTLIDGGYSWNNDGAFSNTGIYGLDIKDGNSALTIGNSAFSLCTNLRYANLSNRLNKINERAFAGDYKLAWVKIKPSNYDLTILGDAFQNDTSLKVITLPRITKLSGNSFSGCKKLKDVYYISNNTDYTNYVNVDSKNTEYLKATIHKSSSGPSSMPTTKYTGWENTGAKSYWYENDVLQGYDAKNPSYRGKEIYDPDSNAWYWLDNVQGGAKAVSKDVYQTSSGGKWVRYDKNGIMIKGWDDQNGKKYYFDPITGAMSKGLTTIDGTRYFFDVNTGVMVTGMVNDNGTEYAFDNNGKAVNNNWVSRDGKSYWYENGVRQGYDSNNAAYRGKEIYDPNSKCWFWLDNVLGGAKAVSKDVYQESSGGKWVRYNSWGEMIKGWSDNNYFDLITGAMYKGWHNIDGRDYYFNEVTGKRENW